jgi:hypothetical protein
MNCSLRPIRGAISCAMTRLALLLAILIAAMTVDARAQAQTTADNASQLSPPRPLPAAFQAERWNAEREAWYRRNRGIAIAGKVSTIIGLTTYITSAVLGNLGSLISGYVLAYGGMLTWSGSDLRATNRFRSWGFRLRKAAAVVSVVGVFTAIPFTVVAGSLQSARIREVHREAIGGTLSPSARVLGAGLGLQF